MVSELIINVNPTEIAIAILEDSRLVELQKEKQDADFSVGNIYVGKVKKMMPALNAAFVDVGYKKDAFLHYLDLGIHFNSYSKFLKQAQETNKCPDIRTMTLEPDTKKEGKIADLLSVGQKVLVQIAKEPISTKGPRLTAELSFAGRFMVLIPFSNKISVSQKIKSKEERIRLKQLIKSLKPNNFGVIVRTMAEGKHVSELDAELQSLVKKWDDNISKITKNTKNPHLIYEETGRAVAIMRDLFNPTFESIYVNDSKVYDDLCKYIETIAPNCKKIVKKYTGDLPIFDSFGITKQIKSLFGRTVTFKNGAYLIIEKTEALHVIDVNSGNRNKSASTQEESAYEINVSAAAEIARQLRLRDLGGIIVIDFIDMLDVSHRNALLTQMQELMSHDRARHKILPLSKFGLMQITRQRVRPEMSVDISEAHQNKKDDIDHVPSILFTDELERYIETIVDKIKINKFLLHLHPYVAAFITQGLFSLKWKWRRRYQAKFKVIPDESLGLLECRFYEDNGNEINVKEYLDMN